MDLSEVTCPISELSYYIIKPDIKTDSDEIFQEWYKDTINHLNKGRTPTFVIECKGFHRGDESNVGYLLQFGEIYDINYDLNTNSDFPNITPSGFIFYLPLSLEVKKQLSKIFGHQNTNIITYDFTTTLTYLYEAKIMINTKKLFDLQLKNAKKSKSYLTYTKCPDMLKEVQNISKDIDPLLQKALEYASNDQPISIYYLEFCAIVDKLQSSIFMTEELLKSNCACIAITALICSSLILEEKVEHVLKLSKEKITEFNVTVKKYNSIFAPFSIRNIAFINETQLRYSKKYTKANRLTKLLMMWKKEQSVVVAERILNKPLTKTKPEENIKNEKNLFSTLKNEIKNIRKFAGIIKINSIKSNEERKIKFEKILEKLEKRFDKNELNSLIQPFKELQKHISNITNKMPPSMPLIYEALSKMNIECEVDEIPLYKLNANQVFSSATTYITSYAEKICDECEEIKDRLFKLVFSPSDGDDFSTRIFSVYQAYDKFLTTENPVIMFQSSTGSGKTRCAPFFFSIKAYKEELKIPFTIMTQKGFSMIKEKIADFQETIGDSIEIVNNVSELMKLYRKEKNVKKPVFALLSPHNALKLLSIAEKQNINVISKTRFCLDEIHERTVESDVLIAKLAELTKSFSLPFQILMMSATPDNRIMNCFENVESVSLDNSELYPIKDINIPVNKEYEINDAAVNCIIEQIKAMAKEENTQGHILCFTSRNVNLKIIEEKLSRKLQEKHEEKYKLLSFSKTAFYNDKDFRKQLNILVTDDENLYVFPIVCAGFVRQSQKSIAISPISEHPNVIKIILATNAIESSITIDKLAVVVDCGVFNQPEYDKESGLTTLKECPISTMNMKQRRGRVGRIMPGICVKIDVKGWKHHDQVPPEILTTDISSSILKLRTIGIYLEKIENLPDKPISKEVEGHIRSLVTMRALDPTTKEITEDGLNLSKFSCLSPFLASAVMNASKDYGDNCAFLSSLIILIALNDEIIEDNLAPKLYEYFEPSSDIVTVLKAFIDYSKLSEKEKEKNVTQFGFDSKAAKQITSSMNEIISNFDDNLKFDDVINEIEKSYIQPDFDLLGFIDKIISIINKNRPIWLQCRSSDYKTAINIETSPKIIMHSNRAFKLGNEIIISTRPGSIGLTIPGSCFVFNIEHNSFNNNNNGTMIHRDITKSNIIGIVSIDDGLFKCGFVIPLLEAYIGTEGMFSPFLQGYFERSAKPINYHVGIFNDKSVLSYAPKDANCIQLTNEAIEKAKILIGFTPNTILFKDEAFKLGVEIYGNGTDKYQSSVFSFKENNRKPYALNKESINYIISHKADLWSANNSLAIAVTGDCLCYDIGNEKIDFPLLEPTVDPSYSAVFCQKPRCHIFVLSNSDIPNGKRLEWIETTRDQAETKPKQIGKVKIINSDFINISEPNTVYFIYSNDHIITMDNIPEIQNQNIKYISDAYKVLISTYFKGECLEKPCSLKNIKVEQKCSDTLLLYLDLLKNKLNIKSAGNIQYLYPQQNKLNELNNLNNRIEALKPNKNSNKTEWFSLINQQKDIIAQLKSLIPKFFGNDNFQKKTLNDVMKDFSKEFQNRIINNNNGIMNLMSLLGNNESSFMNNFGEGMIAIRLHDKTIKDETKERIRNQASSFMSVKHVDGISIYSITIMHQKDDTSKEQFIDQVKTICDQFGVFIYRMSAYHPDTGKNSNGSIKIDIFTEEALRVFIEIVKNTFKIQNMEDFKIPKALAPDLYLSLMDGNKVIESWIKENSLNIKRNGRMWTGIKDEIDKAAALLNDEEKRPKFDFKLVQIPAGLNINFIDRDLRRKHKKSRPNKRWVVDRGTKQLIVPKDTPDEQIKEFLDGFPPALKDENVEIPQVIGDIILFCEDDAVKSSMQLCLFMKDGKPIMRYYCVTCAKEIIAYAIGPLFDVETDSPVIDRLKGNMGIIGPVGLIDCEFEESTGLRWPLLPFGQMAYSLVYEKSLRNIARTWLSSIFIQTLHSSSFVTFCPSHPEILMERPLYAELKCKTVGCPFNMCGGCRKWHKSGECKGEDQIPPGFRRCPKCKNVVCKESGCSAMYCQCKEIWCYYCGKSTLPEEPHEHAAKAHHDYFNDPADYRKYIKGENISDDQLEAFYKECPMWKPK